MNKDEYREEAIELCEGFIKNHSDWSVEVEWARGVEFVLEDYKRLLKQWLEYISTTKKDCHTCIHGNETDGSNCYECIKDMRNNYESTTKNNTVDFNKINELADFAIKATGQRDSYSQGMCNGIEYLRAVLTDTEPKYFDSNDAYKESTTKNDLVFSKQAVLDLIADYDLSMGQVVKGIHNLQEPKCKNCKWWKDSDGKYRRGCGAESKCPINTHEVYEGEGYCYMFSPKVESEK